MAVASSRRWSDLIWVVLAAAGVWLLLGASAAGAKFDLVGIGWALAAACSWACYIVVGRSVTAAFGASTPALALGIAALTLLPVGLHRAGMGLFSPALLPMAFFVAMVAAAIPFSLEMFALPRIPRRTFAVFTSVEPAFGAMSGVVLLHEHMALAQVCGVAAVITAAAGSAWSSAGGGAEASAVEAPQV